MKKNIDGLNISYEYNCLEGKDTLVLLHGWGQNIQMMTPIKKFYEKYYSILILDFPGFGKSEEPSYSWDTEEYTIFLNKLLKKLKIENPILIGHSFGGRIALKYSSMYKVKKLVCLASPFCKELKKLPLKNKFYKFCKNSFCLKWLAKILKNYVGSSDYKNASEVMKGVLVKAINTNLTEDVKKIKCPTLLVWGELDTAVPLNRAYELEKLIKDSGVVVFKGATHYAYLEHLNELIIILDNFFKLRR